MTSPSAVVDGLSCGTSYTVGVVAIDAAENKSEPATLAVQTATCPPVDIPASVFLSPSGNDAAACSAAAPCRSFDRAFRVAAPGQHVELAAGSYGGQSLRADPAKTSADDVVIRPAAGASVTTGSLTVNGAHVTLRGFTVNGDWTTNDATDDVTFQNLVVNGGIYINSSSNISVIGGSVGGTMDTHPQFASWPTGTHIENILVDGVTFHDIRRSNDAVHGECLQIAGGVGVTVRNSTFSNCMVFDLSITEYNGSGPPTDYLIENNVFGPSVDGGYYGLHFNTNTTDFRNFVVRNNSSTQPFSFTGLRKLTNVRRDGQRRAEQLERVHRRDHVPPQRLERREVRRHGRQRAARVREPGCAQLPPGPRCGRAQRERRRGRPVDGPRRRGAAEGRRARRRRLRGRLSRSTTARAGGVA